MPSGIRKHPSNIAVMKKSTLIFSTRPSYKNVENEEQNAPVKPEKDIPSKPNPNPDPTIPRPGGNDPKKNDPTRIEQPQKTDPTRIDEPAPPNPNPEKKETSN